jgi:TonB family protein
MKTSLTNRHSQLAPRVAELKRSAKEMKPAVAITLALTLAGCRGPAPLPLSAASPTSLTGPEVTPEHLATPRISISDETSDGISSNGDTAWRKRPFHALIRTPPGYPFELLRRHIRGDIVVAYTINDRGEVIDPKIITSADPLFSQAVLAAIASWRYKPAMSSIYAMHSKVRVAISFDFAEEPNQSPEPTAPSGRGSF